MKREKRTANKLKGNSSEDKIILRAESTKPKVGCLKTNTNNLWPQSPFIILNN
jgi:hypothetical protein